MQEALYNVTGRLRDNQFSNKLQNGAGMRNSSHRVTTLTQRMGNLGLSHNLDRSPQASFLFFRILFTPIILKCLCF